MKFRTGAIALAALLAMTLGIDRAAADSDCGPMSFWSTPGSGQCNGYKRIPASDATCLNASYNHSYEAFVGYRYTVTNDCQGWGNLMVHVDRVGVTDWIGCLQYSMTSAGTAEYRGFSCCFEGEGDLCWKDQIVKDRDGYIKRMTVTATTSGFEKHDVSTHQARYDFCQEYPNDVYCDVNPEGDALTPPPAPATDCDGEPCTLQHCKDAFAESHAAEHETHTCTGETSMSFEAPTTCTLLGASCGSGTVSAFNNPTARRPVSDDYYIDLHIDDMEDVRLCAFYYCYARRMTGFRWALVEGACPEDAVRSECE